MELDRIVEDFLKPHGHDLGVDGVDEEAGVHHRLAAQGAPAVDRPAHHDRVPPRVDGFLRPPAEQPGPVQGPHRAAVDRVELRQQPELLDGDRHAGRVGTARAAALDHQGQARVVVTMPRGAAVPAALAEHFEDCCRHY
jgi:hypothetical protein